MDARGVLTRKLDAIKLPEEDEAEIGKIIKDFLKSLNSHLKANKAKAVLGGSFSKGTTIRKSKYDVDIFVIFPKKAENVSDSLEKAIRKTGLKAIRLPGSRDYFSIRMKKGFEFRIEVVPVIAIRSAEEAPNVTDVSVLHVDYVKKEIRKKRGLADEIRLAKAFCYAQECYGAESHIKGFSGYCLEILTANYGSFIGLAKAASKWPDQTILDPEKHYKNKDEILTEINEAKLLSPLILIDPVQRNRNAAAALSMEKFDVFRKGCRDFMKKPSEKFFEKKEFSEEKLIAGAKKKKAQLFKVSAFSDKVKEDISGAKLLKLNNLLKLKLEKEGYAFKNEWVFREKDADAYFSISKVPKEVIIKGPPVGNEKGSEAFMKKWRNAQKKGGRFIAKRAPLKPEDALSMNEEMLDEMSIGKFLIKRLA